MLFLKKDISWCDSKYILIEKNVKAVCQELIFLTSPVRAYVEMLVKLWLLNTFC